MNRLVALVPSLLAAVLMTLAAAPAGRAAAAEPPKDAVRARLLADTTAVKPGESFTVGVLLDLKPGWHVYWINPGDSGLATHVKFQTPDGFSVGDLQFPTPVRFTMPDDSVAYGYGDSVLLTARVQAPADLKGAKDVAIAAAVNWLVCKDVCVPGSAKVDLALPVSAQPVAANDGLFRQWSARLPVDAAASADVAKVEWATDPAVSEGTLTVTWKNPAGDIKPIDLFPYPDDALDVRTVSVKADGGRTRLTVRLRVLAGQKPNADDLAAVIGYTNRGGERRGVNTRIPVAAIVGANKK